MSIETFVNILVSVINTYVSDTKLPPLIMEVASSASRTGWVGRIQAMCYSLAHDNISTLLHLQIRTISFLFPKQIYSFLNCSNRPLDTDV